MIFLRSQRKISQSTSTLLCLIIVIMLLSVASSNLLASPDHEAHPVFEPDGAEWLSGNTQFSELPDGLGLQGTIASIDKLYAKKSLAKVSPRTNKWSGTAWRGERINAQILLHSKEDVKQLRLKTEALVSDDGVALPQESLKPQFVRYVLAAQVLYPNIIDPIKTLDIDGPSARPVWVTINVPSNAEPGNYTGKVSVVAKDQKQLDFIFELEVLPLTVPPPADWNFHLDLWQNPFSIARWHGVEFWSDAHFSLMAPYWQMLADAGQKCLTISLFHHPWRAQCYDAYEAMVISTKNPDGSWEYDFSIMDKYVAFAEKNGLDDFINCYSMLPWSNRYRYIDGATGNWEEVVTKPGEPAYKDIWTSFLKAFEKHSKEKGWQGRLTIAMDERAEKEVLIAADILKKNAPSIRLASATNHPPKKFKLDDWAPYIKNDIDVNAVDRRRNNSDLSTTFYVCCVPKKPNMHAYSPPAESAWMGLYAASHNRTGFLIWAFNSWTENPFHETMYWAKLWPAGDCFVIFPGPRTSIHFERLREGIVDFEKLLILRQMAKKQKRNSKITKAIRDLDTALDGIDFKKTQDTDPARPVDVAKQVNPVKAAILNLSKALVK